MAQRRYLLPTLALAGILSAAGLGALLADAWPASDSSDPLTSNVTRSGSVAAATDGPSESDTHSSILPPQSTPTPAPAQDIPPPVPDGTSGSEEVRGSAAGSPASLTEANDAPSPCTPGVCALAGPPPEVIPGEPGGGAIALDCNANASGIQRSCAYPGGSVVDLAVHVAEAPTAGYAGVEVSLAWQEALLSYLPASDSTEILWDGCDSASRSFGPASVYFGCLIYPIPRVGVSETGAVIRLRFHCRDDGNVLIELAPYTPAANGTAFWRPDLTRLYPSLAGVAVSCGPCPNSGCPPPPTSAPTPAPLPTPSPAGSGGMAVDCSASMPGVQNDCAYPLGARFRVQVYVTFAPLDGYFGLQAKLRWQDEQLEYLPGEPTQELVSQDCRLPARARDRDENGPSLLFGCVPFPAANEGLTTTGAVMEFAFACEGVGAASLELAPRLGDPQLGSHFLDETLSPLDPTLAGARIICGSCPSGGCPPPPSIVTPTPEPTPQPAGTGGMAIDCDAGSAGVQTDCSYTSGSTFAVQVHVRYAPAGGYFGLQAKLRWNEAQLQYLPAASPADEALWPDCGIATRADNQVRGDPSVLLGCASFPAPASGSAATGPIFEVILLCEQAGQAQLNLVPRLGDGQLGSHFLDADFGSVDPELRGARITCG